LAYLLSIPILLDVLEIRLDEEYIILVDLILFYKLLDLRVAEDDHVILGLDKIFEVGEVVVKGSLEEQHVPAVDIPKASHEGDLEVLVTAVARCDCE
jgi:hypothetical protein